LSVDNRDTALIDDFRARFGRDEFKFSRRLPVVDY
jgi:hypothetical protein